MSLFPKKWSISLRHSLNIRDMFMQLALDLSAGASFVMDTLMKIYLFAVDHNLAEFFFYFLFFL